MRRRSCRRARRRCRRSRACGRRDTARGPRRSRAADGRRRGSRRTRATVAARHSRRRWAAAGHRAACPATARRRSRCRSRSARLRVAVASASGVVARLGRPRGAVDHRERGLRLVIVVVGASPRCARLHVRVCARVRSVHVGIVDRRARLDERRVEARSRASAPRRCSRARSRCARVSRRAARRSARRARRRPRTADDERGAEGAPRNVRPAVGRSTSFGPMARSADFGDRGVEVRRHEARVLRATPRSARPCRRRRSRGSRRRTWGACSPHRGVTIAPVSISRSTATRIESFAIGCSHCMHFARPVGALSAYGNPPGLARPLPARRPSPCRARHGSARCPGSRRARP